ncbi:hypothetical protein BDW68DRAFT_69704 [Aspergillus falconensis]
METVDILAQVYIACESAVGCTCALGFAGLGLWSLESVAGSGFVKKADLVYGDCCFWAARICTLRFVLLGLDCFSLCWNIDC